MSAPQRCLRLLLLCLLAVSVGCAASAERARSEVDKSRIAYARKLAVERRAPLLFERYERAQKLARSAPEASVARGDYQAEARLWLETAIADSERERLAEQRLAEERTLIALDANILALAQERASWQREAELTAARALASNEAHKALARAAERPTLRVKMPREDVKEAVLALLSRCELLGLTLDALGKQGTGLNRLRQKLDEVQALLPRDPDAALVRADQALFYGLALFAELRGKDGGPSSEERASLAEALASAGVRPTRVDQGLRGVLEHAFSDFALVPVAERVIERLCELAKAYPRGPVLLSVQAKNQAQADARMRWVKLRFARAGCEGQRYTVSNAHVDGDALETNWAVY